MLDGRELMHEIYELVLQNLGLVSTFAPYFFIRGSEIGIAEGLV
jgi:hypothetical protein